MDPTIVANAFDRSKRDNFHIRMLPELVIELHAAARREKRCSSDVLTELAIEYLSKKASEVSEKIAA
jgi:hypothetical protein